jgi:small subunit ribosomal protein S17
MTGVVTRVSSTQTVAVRVDRSYRHPVYAKVMRRAKEFLVHDVLGCRPGDRVRIVETRPVSRRKRWAVEAVLQRAPEATVAAEAAAAAIDRPPEETA